MRQLIALICFLLLGGFKETVSGVTQTNGFEYEISGGEAFVIAYNGTNATNVLVPDFIEGKPVVSVGYAFKYKPILGVKLPSSLKKINELAFYQAKFMTNLVIPAGVTNIGYTAFAECSKLRSIEFASDQLSDLGQAAFYNCSELSAIRIPTNVPSLNSFLFSGCRSLTNVTIKGNLSYVSNRVFESCTSLKQLVFEGAVTNIYSTYISGEYRGVFPGSGLTNIIFKKKVRLIDDGAFYNSKQLQTLILEDDVGTVGSNVFLGCDQLANIYFQGQLTSVSSRAFAELKQLQTMVLPRGLEKIEELAFQNCSNLKEVIFLGDTPPIKPTTIFLDCPDDLIVKIPQVAPAWDSFRGGLYDGRALGTTVTLATLSNYPVAYPIRQGKSLGDSRLTGGKANVSGKFEFENTNTIPPPGISPQPVLFRPDLWYLDELKFDVPVQALTNIPQVNLPPKSVAYMGKRFYLKVDASDGPNTFTQTGLPSGLALGAATGEIQGIPKEVGTHVVEISASNASSYAGLATFELKVGRGTPEIGSAPTASVIRAGQPLAASRLGGGIATNDLGVLPGKFSWLVPDRKPTVGTSLQKARFVPQDLANHQPIVISIPVIALGITSDLSEITLTRGVNQAGLYVVQANMTGVNFTASGLPPGLKLDPRTGILSGRPTRVGTYKASLFAARSPGDRFVAQKTFTVIARSAAATYFEQALSLLKFQPASP